MLRKKLFLFAFLFISVALFAQPELQNNDFDKKFHDFNFHGKLKLTDKQKEDIGNIREAMQAKIIDFEYEIKKTQLQIKKLIKDEKFDDALKLINKISDIEKQIKEVRFTERVKIFNILDNNQKEIFKESFFDRPERMPPFERKRF